MAEPPLAFLLAQPEDLADDAGARRVAAQERPDQPLGVVPGELPPQSGEDLLGLGDAVEELARLAPAVRGVDEEELSELARRVLESAEVAERIEVLEGPRRRPVSWLPQRQGAKSDSALGHTGDGAFLELIAVVFENRRQMIVHVLRPHTAEPKEDDAWKPGSTRSHEISEVQIMCEQDGFFIPCLDENIEIGQPAEILVEKMDCFMARIAQEGCRHGRDAHVEQESHAAGITSTG